MGGGKNPKSSAASNLEDISRQLFNQGSGIRNTFRNRAEDFLSGGMDVTQSPMFGSLKNAIDSQFGRAQQNVIANTPRGGQLSRALTDLELGKANSMTQGIGQLAQSEMDRAFNVGNMSLQGMQGLASAGGIQAQEAMAQAQRQSAGKQSLGFGLGNYLGAGGGFGAKGAGLGGAASVGSQIGGAAAFLCFVAEELYSSLDKIEIIRNFFSRHAYLANIYRRYGQYWALMARKHISARILCHMIFGSIYRVSKYV